MGDPVEDLEDRVKNLESNSRLLLDAETAKKAQRPLIVVIVGLIVTFMGYSAFFAIPNEVKRQVPEQAKKEVTKQLTPEIVKQVDDFKNKIKSLNILISETEKNYQHLQNENPFKEISDQLSELQGVSGLKIASGTSNINLNKIGITEQRIRKIKFKSLEFLKPPIVIVSGDNNPDNYREFLVLQVRDRDQEGFTAQVARTHGPDNRRIEGKFGFTWIAIGR